MSDLLAQFGSIPLALAAYNAGPAPVAACGCVPAYPETQAYVARILALMGGAGAVAGAGARGAAGGLIGGGQPAALPSQYPGRMAATTVSGIDELRELIGKPIGPSDGSRSPRPTSTSSPRSRATTSGSTSTSSAPSARARSGPRSRTAT